MDTPGVWTQDRAVLAVRQKLESLLRAGVEQLPKPPVPLAPAAPAAPVPVAAPVARPLRQPTGVAEAEAPFVARPPVSDPRPTVSAPAADSGTAVVTSAAPKAATSSGAVVQASVGAARPHATGPIAMPFVAGTALAAAERPAALDVIRAEVVACTLCPALVANRTQTVFGVGHPTARLCFFGEAPGADEDRQGEPFVGRAGELLNKMIAACTLQREDVYILNVLKCRPPNNRTPAPDEVANCRGFFECQLEIIRPEFICCLGAVATQALLQTTLSLSKLRGRLHDYRGSKVIVTYHPAYLLRYPEEKAKAWEDLKLLMHHMGLTPATSK